MPSDLDTTEPPRIERVHCNTCGRTNRHTVVAQRVQNGSEPWDDDPRIELSWSTTWTTLECCGCETVCLRRAYWFSEWGDDEQIEFFPPPMARRRPRWADELGEQEGDLLKEIYVALQADSLRLAMMGARTLVDLVMNRDGDHGSFGAGLAALVRRGLIGTQQREVLRAALDVGHAAAHRGHRPSRKDVDIVIDVVEHLLQAELLTPAADGLRTRTPPRPPRRPPSGGDDDPGHSPDEPGPEGPSEPEGGSPEAR